VTTTDSINWRQFATLVRTFTRINARGQAGKTAYARALSIIVSYGISSTYLGISLSRPFYGMGYVFITIMVMMYLSVFTIMSSYSVILLDTTEQKVLSLFPISGTTLFLSRVANMILYALMVGTPFAMPLVVIYAMHTANTVGTLVYMGTLLLCSLWSAGFFILLYNTMIARFAHSTQFITAMQIVLVFLLLFFYQQLPSFSILDAQKVLIYSTRIHLFFPPLWFVALHTTLSGTTPLPSQSLLAVLAIASFMLLALLLKTRWMLLPDINTRAQTAATTHRRHPGFARALDALFRSHRRAKAGFELFRLMLLRERTLRFQIIPVLIMPVAIAVYGLFSGELHSPFHGRLLEASTKLHVPAIVFFLFAARHLEQSAQKAVQPMTTWLLRYQPGTVLEPYARGVHLGFTAFVLLPLSFVMFLIFLAALPVREAALQALFLAVVARFQTAVIQWIRPGVPFSRKEYHLATVQRFGQFFLFFPFFVIVILLHFLTSRSPLLFLIMLLMLEGLTLIASVTSRARAYRIQEAA
jgi:hypothetical protein